MIVINLRKWNWRGTGWYDYSRVRLWGIWTPFVWRRTRVSRTIG